MQYTPAFIVAIIVLLSCNSTNTNNKSKSIRITSTDTVKIVLQKAFSEKALELNLKPINKGVDSFEMRVWISSMFVEQDVTILRYSGSKWHTQKIKYYTSEDSVINFNNEKIEPTISLQLLTDSLKQMHLDKIISQEEIPNFVDNIADGVTYNLEIATKDSYRLLTYHCPEHFSKNEINNKEFMNLIMLLDNYFHFWSPICSI